MCTVQSSAQHARRCSPVHRPERVAHTRPAPATTAGSGVPGSVSWRACQRWSSAGRRCFDMGLRRRVLTTHGQPAAHALVSSFLRACILTRRRRRRGVRSGARWPPAAAGATGQARLVCCKSEASAGDCGLCLHRTRSLEDMERSVRAVRVGLMAGGVHTAGCCNRMLRVYATVRRFQVEQSVPAPRYAMHSWL